jgi:hypothetical protein
MANELTLNPQDNIVEGELSSEEQESLQLGEQIYEAENQLLAGKYESAEELERGYLELQRRLSGGEEPQEEAPEIQEEDDTQYEDEDPSEDLYEAIRDSYEKGEWDDQLVEFINKQNPIDVMNLMLERQGQSQAPTATEQDVAGIQESVGGQEEYGSMIQWASQNLSEQEINLYDAAMDRGDPLTMFFAAQALFARYQDGVGYDGELLTGKAPQSSAQGFRSQAEVLAAMSDPRYDKDPAYRADVAAKLEYSNIQF